MTHQGDGLHREAEIERLRAVLVSIRDGDVPRPVAYSWRDDGKPSKHDQCKHMVSMWQDCSACVEIFIEDALHDAAASGEVGS